MVIRMVATGVSTRGATSAGVTRPTASRGIAKAGPQYVRLTQALLVLVYGILLLFGLIWFKETAAVSTLP